jgi:hypothetical protein
MLGSLYMSPDKRAKTIDHRADIWSLASCSTSSRRAAPPHHIDAWQLTIVICLSP